MELKEFIKSTISAIADATSELQSEYEEKDVIVNPPSAESGSDLYQVKGGEYTLRRVQNVQFDVAVTATSETSGGAKAGVKVFSAEIGANGGKFLGSEKASRVKFAVPIVLAPSVHEVVNTEIAKQERDALNQALRNF